MESTSHQLFLKSTRSLLFLALLLMVACFFTWSEEIAVTRAIKSVGRMGVMVFSIFIYYRILRYGAVNSLTYKSKLPLAFYLAYLFLGLLSIAWSSNVEYSILQLLMTCQSLVFAFYFTRSMFLLDIYFGGHHIQLYRLIANTCFVLLAIFLIGAYLNPLTFFRLTEGGTVARLGGYLMNPNELGMLAGVGTACLLFMLYYKTDKLVWTILKLAVVLFALYLTGSRSSLVGVLLIALFYLVKSTNRHLKLTIGIALLVVTPILVNTIFFKEGSKANVEEVLSMTGRLPFWKALVEEALPNEPLLGFGFMRIWYTDSFKSKHTYPGKMTHNTFLQVLMNLGFVGLCLVLVQLAATIKAIRKENRDKKYLLLGIFIPLLINSFTEFGIFGETNYSILFYQLLIFSISFASRKHFSQQERNFLARKHPKGLMLISAGD